MPPGRKLGHQTGQEGTDRPAGPARALNRELGLDDNVVVGSVNANLYSYDLAATALARADLDWLNHLIIRRVPLERAGEAFEPQADEVKVINTLGGD